MENIPAIVLTYDVNRPFLEHMIRCYQNLWASHPFQFHVPYQEMSECEHANTVMVSTPPGIRDSVLTLLGGFEDDQWIYWCIDDKYPISIDKAMVDKLVAFLSSSDAKRIDGISACRDRALLDGGALRQNKIGLYDAQTLPIVGPVYRRGNYRQIWLHQFLRAGVLRRLFEAFPEQVTRAKELDYAKDRVKLPEEHRLYVTRGNHLTLGESASRGVVTENCLASMLSMGIAPPTTPECAMPSIEIGASSANTWWSSPVRFLRDALSLKCTFRA